MKRFEKKFKVTDWKEKEHFLTPKELYERVLSDSKSDYNWIASATELVRVCNEPRFPKKYAQAIKIIILNCFANLELKKEYPSRGKTTDKEAVYHCYRSLSNTDEKATEVKQKYLKAIISSVVKYSRTEIRLSMHPGPTYNKICEDWKKAKFAEYSSKENIDFDELRAVLYKEFEKLIKAKTEEGVFKEDDEKHREEMKKLFQSIDLKHI